ncbi:gluconokinase [Aerococcus kribbianus]|uniref:FGGY family carbohydrate kinase n=1 Tax=Aerococcus kribbianus TaxID=2999064 RepID=A0A9X3JD31_9LACT|nr:MULTISPECIES: FGGY family carbohydrate kinase [unclassified Aerococcus]MCZ0717080.1 FGGY family carbohydrate kinase [Aerococcus sp. YH-aer221]MCZ0725368.1 FGGY family carbohydrate kinase [Aerococcus sp. YH-aer222]
MTYHYVIDIGTTSIKLGVFTSQGQGPLVTYHRDNQSFSQVPGRHEQNPDFILEQIKVLIAKTKSSYPVNKIVFSSQMHSLMITDSTFTPLTRLLTWADQRAGDLALRWRHSQKGQNYQKLTGTPLHAMSPLAKLAYFRLHQAELLQTSNYIMGIKSYIIYSLTREYVCDQSLASTTGLYASETGHWAASILTDLGISESQLPTVKKLASSYPISSKVAQELGVKESLEIVLGGADGTLANFAYLEQTTSYPLLSFGTSGAVRLSQGNFVVDELGQYFTYILDDDGHYLRGAPLNNMGNVLARLHQEAYSQYSFSTMLDQLLAQTSQQPGPEIFLPYCHGERAPFWNARLKPGFYDIRPTTRPKDKHRAVIEGIFLQLRLVLTGLEREIKLKDKKLLVNGRIFTHPGMGQWLADISGWTIEVLDVGDASLLGANRLITGVKADVSSGPQYCPHPISAQAYDKKFHRFAELAQACHENSLSDII